MTTDARDPSGGEASDQVRTAPAEGMLPFSGNRIDSRDLFVSSREIVIAHGEETYRLRLTSQNKLILTK